MSDNIPTVQYPMTPDAAEALMESGAEGDPRAGLDRILARGRGNLTPSDIMHGRVEIANGRPFSPASTDTLSGVDRTLANGREGFTPADIARQRKAARAQNSDGSVGK